MSAVINWIYDHTAMIHIPLVNRMHTLKQNVFLNTSRVEATGLERIGNWLLAPARYFLDGKTVTTINPRKFTYKQSFDYTKDSGRVEVIKTVFAILSLPIVLLLGGAVKGLSFLSRDVQTKHQAIKASLYAEKLHRNNKFYKKNEVKHVFSKEVLSSQKIPSPKPTPEQQKLINAVHDASKILEKAHIPHWLSCGTLLGAFRHGGKDGGMIPYDSDVDMAIPAVEHDNAFKVLKAKLDPHKYAVQDWSGCRCPNMYIRIFIKGTKSYLDLYHHVINEKDRTIQYVYTLKDSPFVPQSTKDRETPCTTLYSLDDIFPLKGAAFHGVNVRVPAHWQKYLEGMYGKDLSPCKIWDPDTQTYKKVEDHPYWKTHEW